MNFSVHAITKNRYTTYYWTFQSTLEVTIQASDPPCLWNPGQTSPDVQNRGIIGPQKGLIAKKRPLKIHTDSPTALVSHLLELRMLIAWCLIHLFLLSNVLQMFLNDWSLTRKLYGILNRSYYFQRRWNGQPKNNNWAQSGTGEFLKVVLVSGTCGLDGKNISNWMEHIFKVNGQGRLSTCIPKGN